MDDSIRERAILQACVEAGHLHWCLMMARRSCAQRLKISYHSLCKDLCLRDSMFPHPAKTMTTKTPMKEIEMVYSSSEQAECGNACAFRKNITDRERLHKILVTIGLVDVDKSEECPSSGVAMS
jgi:hypothetical protein